MEIDPSILRGRIKYFREANNSFQMCFITHMYIFIFA